MVGILRTALFLCAVSAGLPVPGRAETASSDVIEAATVVDLVPQARLFRAPSKSPQTLVEGRELLVGDRVSTSDAGTLGMVLRDGSTLRLTVNSEMSFLAPDEKGGLLQLIKGILRSSVVKQDGHHFQVRTPGAVAAVKGTQWQIKADAAGTQVQVLNGVVDLKPLSGTGQVEIQAGEEAQQDQDGLGPVRRMDAAEMQALRVAFRDRVFSVSKAYQDRVRALRAPDSSQATTPEAKP
jgi:hypothetical protein